MLFEQFSERSRGVVLPLPAVVAVLLDIGPTNLLIPSRDSKSYITTIVIVVIVVIIVCSVQRKMRHQENNPAP